MLFNHVFFLEFSRQFTRWKKPFNGLSSEIYKIALNLHLSKYVLSGLVARQKVHFEIRLFISSSSISVANLVTRDSRHFLQVASIKLAEMQNVPNWTRSRSMHASLRFHRFRLTKSLKHSINAWGQNEINWGQCGNDI